jgi:hypothetical protein
MKRVGVIKKMISEVRSDSPPDPLHVYYHLPIGDDNIPMNGLLNQRIHFTYQGEIYCMHCGNRTKKSYGQGYCYTCFISIPETGECILRPELCQAHLGISRNMEWSKTHCLQEHYVYLAISSGLKVGVTRASQVPTRWIDQGAYRAILLAGTPNRHLAGKIEVALKSHFADKTNWRDMLRNYQDTSIDLLVGKEKASEMIPDNLREYRLSDNRIWEFRYPVEIYPEMVKSIGFDKEPECSGILRGIKGQYLIFEGGEVLNIRKHNGYLVELEMN